MSISALKQTVGPDRLFSSQGGYYFDQSSQTLLCFSLELAGVRTLTPGQEEPELGTVPTIMVSSTFYDLRQVRRDLAEFIGNELGFAALLSELPSFPIDPDQDTIENCRRRVSRDVDILLLIVGGRYGSLDPHTGKSITNLEYLTARAKGIPIYTFVERRVLDVMPVWRTNPTSDYSRVVDTVQLFAFVDEIRTQQRAWVFPFDTAQDIITTLRLQLAYLFLDALQLRQQLSGNSIPSWLSTVGAQTARIALERPPSWEYLLFFQGWIDENERRAWAVRDYETKLAIGPSEAVPTPEAANWLQTRMHELQGLIQFARHVVDVAAPQAFGEPGTPGNVEHILWVDRKLGEILDEAFRWTARVRRARFEEPFIDVASEMAAFTSEVIDELRHAPVRMFAEFQEALAAHTPGTSQELPFTITFRMPNTDRFDTALARARRILDHGG